MSDLSSVEASIYFLYSYIDAISKQFYERAGLEISNTINIFEIQIWKHAHMLPRLCYIARIE